MNIDRYRAVALVILGIAIGCGASTIYFYDFVADRADDGLPMTIGLHLYEVREVVPDRGGNLSEAWDEMRTIGSYK